ncbi:MAG: hypothetical protein KJP02_05610 [Octadecabacter sp.]|nr:hypothetical protein [Octadecabacter sp.]
MTIDANLDKRLHRIVRRHDRMKRNGVIHSVGRDGLIRTRPRLIRPAEPLRGVALAIGLLMLFKAALFAQVGPLAYDDRVEAMRSGSSLEQAGALLMQKEPVTVMLGGYMKTYVFR